MRHGTSTTVRALVVGGVALALAPFAATASYAGVRQTGTTVKVKGTAANKFDPSDIKATADKDGNITIEFTSEGAPHTIQSNDVPGFDSGNVNAGETKKITFKAPGAGTYKVVCLYHESVGMVGSLVVGGGAEKTPSAAPSSAAPASASASASVGAPAGGDNAPTAGTNDGGGDSEEESDVPGVAGNQVLERIKAERAADEGAVSGFKFFTMVCIAFLFILGAAVLFSTRPRRAAR